MEKMHLTLYILLCSVICTMMGIDKIKKRSELSYHNPIYITVGNCCFKRLQVKEMSGTWQAERESCLLVRDQMLSGCIDAAASPRP